jgi:NADPH2:quinone reductase
MILIQLCKLSGATVIGVTSSQEKIEFVKDLGADFAFLDTEINKIVKTVGAKPKFIMESYGGKHFMSYYSMLATGGHICSYGASSREGLPSIQIRDLLKDTKTVSGFWGTALFLHDSDRLGKVVNALFDLIKDKKIKIVIGDKMSLKDAKIMHEKIRDRLTLGKLILTNDI